MKQVLIMIVLSLSCAAVFSGALAFAILAWGEPSATPPGNNVAAPVNTGPATQVKSGILGFGNTNLSQGNDPYYIKETGGTFQLIPRDPVNAPSLEIGSNGYVGIGTAAASKQLDVNGYVNGQAGLCINGKCCSQWKGCLSIPYRHVSKTCAASVGGCGVNIALVMDRSTSIDDSSLALMKGAFKNFVSTLSGTSSEYCVIDFNKTATVRQSFTADIDSINSAIDKVKIDVAGTNWEDALVKARQEFDSLPSDRKDRKNLIIFASDGNPYHCNGNGCDPQAAALKEAKTIKNSGTRIMGLGVGSDLTPANMIALASPNLYYAVADFGKLPGVLQGIAGELCGGTINVRKIIDADGNLGTTGDQIKINSNELAQWPFDIASQTDMITDKNGKTDSVCVISSQGPFSVTEQSAKSKSNYLFIGASCTGSSMSNGALSMPLTLRTISGINVGNKDIVSCTFYNEPSP